MRLRACTAPRSLAAWYAPLLRNSIHHLTTTMLYSSIALPRQRSSGTGLPQRLLPVWHPRLSARGPQRLKSRPGGANIELPVWGRQAGTGTGTTRGHGRACASMSFQLRTRGLPGSNSSSTSTLRVSTRSSSACIVAHNPGPLIHLPSAGANVHMHRYVVDTFNTHKLAVCLMCT